MTRTTATDPRVKASASGRPQALYRKLIDSLPDAILVIAEGSPTYVLANAAAQRLLGYSRDRLLALRPAEVSASEELPRVAAIMRTVRERGKWRGEWRLRRKDGSEIPTEATVTRLVLDGRVMYQALFRDLTERKRAGEAQRFLAEAGALLAASLDYEATLQSVARLAVPILADLCVVDIAGEDGRLERLAVAHADPSKEESAREVLLRYPPDPNGPHPIIEVLRTGRPALYPTIPETLLQAIARDAEHFRSMRSLRAESAMILPLVARDRTVGVRSLVCDQSGCRHAPADLALAQELCHLAALAIDNARLHREVQERQQRYHDLVSGLDAIVWEADAGTWQFTFVSRRAEEILGYPVERWRDEPNFWVRLIYPEDRDYVVDLCRTASSEGRDHEFDYRAVAADGRVVWLRDTVRVALDEHGRPRQLRGVMVDITDRKRVELLERDRNRVVELVARNEPLPAILTELVHLIERQRPEMIGSVLLLRDGRLYHGAAPSLPDSYNRAIDGMMIGPGVGSCGTAAYRGETVIVSDIAHDPLWADYRELGLAHGLRACWSVPIFSPANEVLGTFAMYYREPREPEPEDFELLEVASRLAAIAIENANLFEQAATADALRELARLKAEFLNTASHELRTPLGLIYGYAELLIHRSRELSPERVAEMAAEIYAGSSTMVRLVDDLLDFSRLDQGNLRLQPRQVDVTELLSRLIETFRYHPGGGRIRAELPERSEAYLDPDRLSQVVSNLLSNARAKEMLDWAPRHSWRTPPA